jgi:N-methylhydantoinase A
VSIYSELAEASAKQLQCSGLSGDRVEMVRSVDMRYIGQEHTVRVPIPPDSVLHENGLSTLKSWFDELHKQAYAHASPGTPTELVNMRLAAIVPMPRPKPKRIPPGAGDGALAIKAQRRVFFKQADGEVDCLIYDREKLGAGDKFDGPAIVEEWNSTVIVLPSQSLEVDIYGNLAILTP